MANSFGGDAPGDFAKFVILLQVLILVFFALTVEFKAANDSDYSSTDWDLVDWYYPMYQDVHVMIFIGFGFLMTFLAKYSWSSVSYNMLVSCLCIQWGILADGFWRCFFNDEWTAIPMTMPAAIQGDFTAATVIISFGGLLGRITPGQLLAMAFIEIPLFAFNEQLCLKHFEAVDIGGSIFIHTFGAYFGLAVSTIVGPPEGDAKRADQRNSSVYTSDLFAMLGTIFLFIFWPSFNAAMCPNDHFARERVILCTLVAICGSTMMAFPCSRLFEPGSKFNMVHIQNATLAGGVAVGTSSDLILSPYTAMLIGMIAGTLSTYGYVFISPWLERIGVRDTCGIHNLHGLPGLLGGISSIFCSWLHNSSAYGDISKVMPARGDGRSGAAQGLYQLAALLMTLFIAIISGLLAGKVIMCSPGKKETKAFSDVPHWLVHVDQVELERMSCQSVTLSQSAQGRQTSIVNILSTNI